MAKKTRARPGGDERRDSLVRAAFACLAADGFEGLRTRSVADRAGVNIATLHYYFPTKEALIGGVADYLASQFITLHAPPVASTGKAALDRLHQEFADAHFYSAERPELGAVLNELQLRGRRDPAIRKIIEPLFGHWRYGIERFLAAGIEDGVFRSDLDPAAGAALFVAAMTGASCLRLRRAELDAIFAAIEAWLMPREKPPAASTPRAAREPDRRPRRSCLMRSASTPAWSASQPRPC
jgi:TetR/AcrR family transcriptional regulator, regulator of cefoperazone and chloramphenicol sensitivity